mgnify:CR=1 FL=1
MIILYRLMWFGYFRIVFLGTRKVFIKIIIFLFSSKKTSFCLNLLGLCIDIITSWTNILLAFKKHSSTFRKTNVNILPLWIIFINLDIIVTWTYVMQSRNRLYISTWFRKKTVLSVIKEILMVRVFYSVFKFSL